MSNKHIEELLDQALKEYEILENRIEKALNYLKDTPKIVKSIHYRDKDSCFIFIENKVKKDLSEILEGKE